MPSKAQAARAARYLQTLRIGRKTELMPKVLTHAPASIRIKHPLDFLCVAGLGKRQHQQHAGLLRAERVGNDEIKLVVVGFAVARNHTIAHAGTSHDDYAFLARL